MKCQKLLNRLFNYSHQRRSSSEWSPVAALSAGSVAKGIGNTHPWRYLPIADKVVRDWIVVVDGFYRPVDCVYVRVVTRDFGPLWSVLVPRSAVASQCGVLGSDRLSQPS